MKLSALFAYKQLIYPAAKLYIAQSMYAHARREDAGISRRHPPLSINKLKSYYPPKSILILVE